MSTLEWRREQPRVEPPHRDPMLIALKVLVFAAIAGDFTIFIGGGEWYMLAGTLFAGHIAARNV